MSLRINGRDWTFKQIHGVQIVNGVEHFAVPDPETHCVSVSDSISPEAQMEAAAAAALDISTASIPRWPPDRSALGGDGENFDARQRLRRRGGADCDSRHRRSS